MTQRLPQPILVISDGTGETAERVIRAALQQFRSHLVYIRTFRGVERDDQLVAVFRVAARQGAFVVSTLVSDDARARARAHPTANVIDLDRSRGLHTRRVVHHGARGVRVQPVQLDKKQK